MTEQIPIGKQPDQSGRHVYTRWDEILNPVSPSTQAKKPTLEPARITPRETYSREFDGSHFQPKPMLESLPTLKLKPGKPVLLKTGPPVEVDSETLATMTSRSVEEQANVHKIFRRFRSLLDEGFVTLEDLDYVNGHRDEFELYERLTQPQNH